MMKNLIVLCCFTCLHLVFAAVPHSHSHKDSGERTIDGAYSPRDHGHYKDGHDSSFDHEAILGSSKDAEEFDQLPPAEAKKRLQVTATYK